MAKEEEEVVDHEGPSSSGSNGENTVMNCRPSSSPSSTATATTTRTTIMEELEADIRGQGNDDNDDVWLRIIQINDVYELDNFPHFKTLVDKNSIHPDKTLVVLAGDFLGPSLLASLDKGRGIVDCMNESGITHVCLGNHETDVPMNALATRIKVDSKFKWINTNLRELDDKINVVTPPHEIIEVSSNKGTTKKKVGLMGLLTNDPSVYRPGVFAGATIEPVIDTAKQYMKDVLEPLDLDLVIPLTHQRINEDQEFCEAFATTTTTAIAAKTNETVPQDETSNNNTTSHHVFPIVIGGHDHEPYDQTYCNGQSRVIKTGMDGENTAIIDIIWRGDNNNKNNSKSKSRPEITVKMIPTNTYPPDPAMMKRVACHERILHELNRAKIVQIRTLLSDDNNDNDNPDGELLLSTKNNRLGDGNGTRILNTMLRMGMRAEIGLFNAGNVRGGNTYPADQEWFTMSDLKAEIPFSVGICAVWLPGQVIEDTINESRSKARLDPPVASGGYIHTCDKTIFSEKERRIISINGEPFDPNRMYLTSFPTNWFEGMDDHTPILEWAKDTPYRHAKESSSKPAKVVIVELYSAAVWLKMGSFDEIDANGDGVLTHDEVRAKALEVFGDDVADLVVDNIFSVADGDQDGIITPLDMMVVQFVASDMISHIPTEEEVSTLQKVASEVLDKHPTHEQVYKTMHALRNVLDIDNNGKITRNEAMNSIGEIRRRSLLM